jgi:hypothetical protein
VIHSLLSAVPAGVLHIALAGTLLKAGSGTEPSTVDHSAGFKGSRGKKETSIEDH